MMINLKLKLYSWVLQSTDPKDSKILNKHRRSQKILPALRLDIFFILFGACVEPTKQVLVQVVPIETIA